MYLTQQECLCYILLEPCVLVGYYGLIVGILSERLANDPQLLLFLVVINLNEVCCNTRLPQFAFFHPGRPLGVLMVLRYVWYIRHDKTKQNKNCCFKFGRTDRNKVKQSVTCVLGRSQIGPIKTGSIGLGSDFGPTKNPRTDLGYLSLEVHKKID